MAAEQLDFSSSHQFEFKLMVFFGATLYKFHLSAGWKAAVMTHVAYVKMFLATWQAAGANHYQPANKINIPEFAVKIMTYF